MADIVIPGKPRKSLTIDLVGRTYKARPPKASVAVVLAKRIQAAGDDIESLMEALGHWTRTVFGAKTGDEILARVQDDDDDLDVFDLASLMKALIAEWSGNPTT